MATGTSLRAAVVTIVAAASWTASHRAAAAADALIANPRTQPITITASDLGSHSVALGVGKSIVVDLPRDIKDVLVADPKIANAVVRSAQRAYIIGAAVGQTNIVFFDSAGQQIAAYDIAVKRDLNGIRAALRQALPNADIQIDGLGDGVVTGVFLAGGLGHVPAVQGHLHEQHRAHVGGRGGVAHDAELAFPGVRL